jgi:very-short-patch-repair endonuclease
MFLKKKQIADQKFRRQVNIGQYFVDFYCPKLRLVIEIDGKIHQDPKIKENDINRQSFLESLGLVVLRFSNFDINYHIEVVLETIKTFLLNRSKSPSPYEGEG